MSPADASSEPRAYLQVYERLVAAVRAGTTVTYAQLAALAGLDLHAPAGRAALAALLDAINTAEMAAGRPMLTATVVLAGRGMPGRGFFECAQRLGRYRPCANDRAFWQAELRRVYDCWSAR